MHTNCKNSSTLKLFSHIQCNRMHFIALFIEHVVNVQKCRTAKSKTLCLCSAAGRWGWWSESHVLTLSDFTKARTSSWEYDVNQKHHVHCSIVRRSVSLSGQQTVFRKSLTQRLWLQTIFNKELSQLSWTLSQYWSLLSRTQCSTREARTCTDQSGLAAAGTWLMHQFP